MPSVARRPWAVGALIVLATPALLPLLSAAAAWTAPAGEVWAHQLQYVLPRVASNTALLLLIVGASTGILGTALAWLVAGGVSCTLGAVVYLFDSKLRYAHFAWHLFVMAGSACHFFAVLWYAA